MRAVLLVAAVVLVLASCAPAAKSAERGITTALEMASYCKPVAEASRTSDGKLSFKSTFETGRCWGFFDAIQQAATLQYSDAPARALYICVPPGGTLSQMVLIFRRYVEVNPSVGHEEAFFVARDALVEAFPCKG